MPDSANKAVFLSYASQDAEAARRICEALRSGGVEVWFDVEGGLEHGDEWDAKIRKQIKECVLLIAVISGNTQARPEGYFRIEWDLAAERARGIASGVPFILPVVIDDTREPDALVPDRFRMVQWTRLPGGIVPPEVKARFLKLWSHRIGAPSNEIGRTQSGSVSSDPALASNASGGPKRMIFPLVAFALLVIGASGAWWFLHPSAAKSTVSVPAASSVATQPPVAAAAARDWPRDPDLKQAIALIDNIDATVDDCILAEKIAGRAVEKSVSDPEAVTVMARVESSFVLRNFDFSDERTATAKRYAESAVRLAPDDPEALYALAIVLTDRLHENARAESLLRRACALAPNQPRYWRALSRVVGRERPSEGLAIAEENIQRFPRDALTHYDLSISYRDLGRFPEFERELDATLVLAPIANAIDWKSRAEMNHGDLVATRQWLDRVPDRARTEERSVQASVMYAALSGDYDYGLTALQGFSDVWFNDTNSYCGPKELLSALLLQMQGKAGLARLHFEAALTEINRHKAINPADMNGNMAEVWALFGLGRIDEARAANRVYLESLNRPYRLFALTSWMLTPIPASLLLGDRSDAIQLIREATRMPEASEAIRGFLKLDPRMAPWRQDPEINAILSPSAPTGK